MRRFALLILLAMALPSPSLAQEVQRERVHIEHGVAATTIRDSIVGRGSHEYLVGLRAGQVLRVGLVSGSGHVAFNVFAPGRRPGEAEALIIGAVAGPEAELRAAEDGEYLIQVFQSRAAGRRGERAPFALRVGVSGGGEPAGAPPSPGTAARAARGAFDARAELPCAIGTGATTSRCPASVARGPAGEATVVVSLPGGGTRMLFFVQGQFASTDAAAAPGWPQVQRDGDLTLIRLQRERYEVPDAFILGG
ncbi:MAG: hypothetical protein O9325_17680 [Roseomonas sp.]|nr:hypothetical protein [Roseomonas sp.]